MLYQEKVVVVLVLVVSSAVAETVGKGVGLSELEFIVGEMSYAECQQLADVLRADFGSKTPEEGVTCLDDLIRQQSELESEGSNIARGIFRHKLNQIGRRDLAEWLSIIREPMIKSRPRNSAYYQSVGGLGGDSGSLDVMGKTVPRTWCETAVTVALVYTAALLVWLTVRIILCRMKRELRTRGLANNGLHGYSYYPSRMDEYPQHFQSPYPAQAYPAPNIQAMPSHHQYYLPQPKASTKSMQH